MNSEFLTKIIESTQERVGAIRATTDLGRLRDQAVESRAHCPTNRLRSSLKQTHRTNIIAEIKRASPSKGIINDNVDVGEQACAYANGGACAISVLTEERYFKGSIADLERVRSVVDIPLLRKDFTIDRIQIYEAAIAGADAILLIVAALPTETLSDLQTLALKLGLDAVVEVHTAEELMTAAQLGASIIGVNNRNLNTFDVSLDVSRELIRSRPDGALMIAESGISDRKEIDELKSLGYNGFLIGESLMRSGDSGQRLEALV